MNKKTLIIFLSVLATCGVVSAQVSEPMGDLLFQDTLTVDPMNEWISIPSPEENLWQVGIAQKSKLDSSFSGLPVIITDTLNSYPAGADDWFYLSIPGSDENPNWYSWAEGILSFRHRFHTDSLMDGGFIEISYDRGESWVNIIYDDPVMQEFTGLYSPDDTITGGIPAFSGTSDGWHYTEFHWVWYALVKTATIQTDGIPVMRFRFVSDGNDTGKDGWLIDELVFRGYSVFGAVEDQRGEEFHVFPNPCKYFLYVDYQAIGFRPLFRIYNGDGKLMSEKILYGPEILDVSFLVPGVYFYSVLNGNETLQQGTIVKQE